MRSRKMDNLVQKGSLMSKVSEFFLFQNNVSGRFFFKKNANELENKTKKGRSGQEKF